MNTQAPDRMAVECADDVPHVRITFDPPRDHRVGEWLRGTTPDEAIARVGLAYSICRHAQQAAACLVMEAARGNRRSTDDAASTRQVQDEWLREHACNLMLSWPKLLGQPEEPALARLLVHAGQHASTQQDTLAGCLRSDVLGMAPDAFLSMDACGLEAWCTHAGTATAARFRAWRNGPACNGASPPMLPGLPDWDAATAATLANHMRDDPDFCRHPHWHGRTVEIGAHARQRGHSLLEAWRRMSGNDPAARMLARLVELAAAATGRFIGTTLRAWTLGTGEGIAAVETARGPLLHHVQLDGHRVESYHVLAPTEWNFHPRGLLVQAARLRDRQRESLRDWVLALDPCETCRVEVLDA